MKTVINLHLKGKIDMVFRIGGLLFVEGPSAFKNRIAIYVDLWIDTLPHSGDVV